MENEMLPIVATFEEFQSMLLSACIHVCTDHKSWTFDDLKTQRALRWWNKIEEFFPWLHYIEGKKNILGDNLSQLLCLPTPSQIKEGKKLVEPAIVSEDKDDKTIFLCQAKTPAVSIKTSTTFFNVTWIYLQSQIWHKTPWVFPAYANSSSKTNNFWLYKWSTRAVHLEVARQRCWWHHMLCTTMRQSWQTMAHCNTPTNVGRNH
jgi:hypothetical protein